MTDVGKGGNQTQNRRLPVPRKSRRLDEGTGTSSSAQPLHLLEKEHCPGPRRRLDKVTTSSIHPLDLNCAILSEQIYSDVTPGPWFKRIQKTASNNTFAPTTSVFKRKNTIWVVFGGSTRAQDVITNVSFAGCSPFDFDDSGLKVHAGMWTNLKEVMQARIAPCLESIISSSQQKDAITTIVLTGHSLGGAYAILSRLFFAMAPSIDQSTFRGVSFHVVTFGSPLVVAHQSGRLGAAEGVLKTIGEDIRNYVNGLDIVPRLLGPKFGDWRGFVKGGFWGGKGLGVGFAAASMVLLNSGTGGMALSAAAVGSGFYAFYTAHKYGGATQMTIAQLLAAPTLRDKWLAMLESEEARSYFPLGHFIRLDRGEGMFQPELGDMHAVRSMLDVPHGHDAYPKSIRSHRIGEYRELLTALL